MDGAIWIILIIAVGGGILVASLSMGTQRLEQLQRYWDVEVGMSEAEMLAPLSMMTSTAGTIIEVFKNGSPIPTCLWQKQNAPRSAC